MSAPAPVVATPSPQQRRATRWRSVRTWLFRGVAGLAALALLWLMFAPDATEVELVAVSQGSMQVSIDNQGQVRMREKYVIAAPVAAELGRIALRDGDAVRRDQLLAVLKPMPLDERQRQEASARVDAARALAREAALRTARSYSDLQLAISERSRIDGLVKNNFVSQQAADRARSAETASRAEWNAAQSREQAALADIRVAQAALQAGGQTGGARSVSIVSPINGTVLRVHEPSERTVAAGTPLLTIGDPARFEIVVDVLSVDAVKIKTGDAMLVDGWGGSNTLSATVRRVEPLAFTRISALGVEEQRVNVLADPIDALGPLGDGYRVEARIIIWTGENVTKVPGSSLFRVGTDWHVFVAEQGRARERTVVVGQRNQDEAQILEGLAPGTMVIRYPGNQIRDGARIAAAAR